MPVVLHAAAGPGGPIGPVHARRPLAGPLDPTPHSIDGDSELLAEAATGLPDNAARTEAMAVRLRARGVELTWGKPIALGEGELLDRTRAFGRGSVEVLRADPSLLPELRIGGWCNAGLRLRLARPALLRAPRLPLPARIRTELAFWSGVRAAAAPEEWRRLTSGYTALIYHRIAGEMKPGQERLDLPPERFRGQVALLRRLRFHPLSADELIAFHAGGAALPRRSVCLTADDAYLDCTLELERAGDRRPLLFVPTDAIGGEAHWADGEPVAGWPELAALRGAGGEVGAHSRSHVGLPGLDDHRLRDEVAGSLAAVGAPSLFAYPHGQHDARVREAVRGVGATVAFTTEIGRNGAGTDRWCLRRIGVKAWDTRATFLWKALTGENLPARWERRLERRAGLPSSPTVAGPDAAPPAAERPWPPAS